MNTKVLWRRLVHRGQDRGKSLLNLATHVWMREYVEFVLADRREGTRSNLRGVEPGLRKRGESGRKRARGACAVRYLRWTVARRPIAPTLADAGANKRGAEHSDPNAKRLELHRQPLRHVDHCEFARPVRAKSESALHTSPGCGVDDVAALTMGADVRKEGSDTVKDSHQVDVEHPSPTFERDVVDTAT